MLGTQEIGRAPPAQRPFHFPRGFIVAPLSSRCYRRAVIVAPLNVALSSSRALLRRPALNESARKSRN
jgi:hypothetical protein